MAEDKPSVCISFEPRDEAAALRVASALREAGIVVMLASEEGTAAVDACDLFLPIVSDNTQTQSAGRFRNEWQRAAQRAEAMRDDLTFLLPVVVDNTANREAKVPPAFHGRAWLRFDVWGSTTPLVSRVEAMLERRTAAQAEAAAEQKAAAEALARSWVRRWVKRLPPWVRRLRVVWIVTLVVLPGGVIAFRLREAKQAEQARAEAAEEMEVPVVPVVRVGRVSAPTEPAAATSTANRIGSGAPTTAVERRDASVSDASSTVGISTFTQGGAGQATDSNPEPGGIAGPSRAWLPQPEQRGASAGPLRPLERAATERELWSALGGAAAHSGSGWHPDAETPAAVAADLAAAGSAGVEVELGIDPGGEVLHALWRDDPVAALTLLAENVADWWDTAMFTGPGAVLEGLCWQARRPELGVEADQRARAAWLRALDQVRARRGERPQEVELALVEAQVRILLGQEVAALSALREYDDSVIGQQAGPQREHLIVWAILGDYAQVMDEIVARFRDGKARWAEVRDWLRYDPRFEGWRETMAGRARDGRD